ncbi:MAG: hypothetical protein A2X93_04815 [Deltaproteobacteria bacterium GWC2_56_8]|nr:MAG: hypothetical protein A2X99_10090 [Deltaproteobacteria bacterium GWB2_55_19]OGP36841.1 MAG: hypothetical protein A2X93_04815 [Deltaproteobacteria bacterium GWC2_56_8]
MNIMRHRAGRGGRSGGGCEMTGVMNPLDYEHLAKELLWVSLRDLNGSDDKLRNSAREWFENDEEEDIFSFGFIRDYFGFKVHSVNDLYLEYLQPGRTKELKVRLH